jgi:CheY-like chemotaxis protein
MAHILVVEDEVDVRFLLRIQLESAGHSILEAQDGQAALDMLEAYPNSFDMILLDIRMPRMDGIKFLSALHPPSSYLPIVVLTAHWEPVPKALAHLVNGHLTKPVGTHELISRVNNLLRVQSV